MIFGTIDVSLLIEIAHQAGEAIMKVYNTDFAVEDKADNSPLTLADKRANEIIQSRLNYFYPTIPYLSEESKMVDYEVRKHWTRYWLIDPLDGTKEFVKKNGEFTVNIALIENGEPVIGVVFAPALGQTYYGAKGLGARKIYANVVYPLPNNFVSYRHKSKLVIVASRSHLSEETRQYIEGIGHGKTVDFISSGSSLKFCLVAEGVADIYPRLAPTMEWDTAAAQAIVESTGRKVINLNTGMSLTYNKPNLLNPYFVVE